MWPGTRGRAPLTAAEATTGARLHIRQQVARTAHTHASAQVGSQPQRTHPGRRQVPPSTPSSLSSPADTEAPAAGCVSGTGAHLLGANCCTSAGWRRRGAGSSARAGWSRLLLHHTEVAGEGALRVLCVALGVTAVAPQVFHLLLQHLQLLAQPVQGGKAQEEEGRVVTSSMDGAPRRLRRKAQHHGALLPASRSTHLRFWSSSSSM